MFSVRTQLSFLKTDFCHIPMHDIWWQSHLQTKIFLKKKTIDRYIFLQFVLLFYPATVDTLRLIPDIGEKSFSTYK